jgi:hypothetical protein
VTAWLIPAIPDGVIYAASMVLLHSARTGQRPPVLAWFALSFGIVATLAGNVLHGLSGGPVGAAFAALPAIGLVLAFELLMVLIRRSGAATVGQTPMVADADSPMGEEDHVSTIVEEDRQPVPDGPGYVPEPLPEELATAAASRFLADVITGETPSIRTIKAELGVGQYRAQQVRAYLATLAAQ